MRKFIKVAVLGALVIASSSCKKYLDVNENPNNPTSSTPNIVLPQAILLTANSTTAFDDFGGWVAGYKANAGGYGGFGTEWTYQYTTSNYTGMWSGAFNAINQANFVLSNTDANGPLKYYNAMARIMKDYNYQRLVDQYGDVPYSDAGQGIAKLSPKYDKYDAVYKAVYADLDSAIAILNSPAETNVTVNVTDGQDPLYGGSTAAGKTKWIQLANTIKLKMLVRARKATELASWVTTAKATLPQTSAGYITDDAIVNPGFNATTASQFNPKWSANAWDVNGTASGTGLSRIPTPWIVSFYDGTKLADTTRGKASYANFGVRISQTIGLTTVTFVGPATNQLGYDVDPVKRSASGSIWYSGLQFPSATRVTGTNANKAANNVGILKSAAMGQVLMLAAESYLLQAEAAMPSVNLVPGATKTLFENGITASINYLYKNSAGAYINPKPAATLKNDYIGANPNSYLVNFDLATTDEQKLEAIITQKYIAVNFINSEEGYNEFRRTGYPRIVPGSTVATETFASLKAPNDLPARVLYPATEFQVNADNVPKDVTTKTKLFYAK